MIDQFLRFSAVSLSLSAAAIAQAQEPLSEYPGSKPIRMIVPFPPGGGTDILSRIVAHKLTEQNQWTVVVDNRAGAGGTIGITEATRTQPTGYDIVMGQKDNLVLGYHLYKGLPWNPLKDLVPVAHVAYAPLVIATDASSKFATLHEVIAAAKADPGKFTYGSAGNGTSNHIAGALFERAAGITLTHVPYRGSNPALMDAMSGNVDLLVTSVPSAAAHIKSGKLRPLAVTSAKRSSSFPNVPTVAEFGMKGFDLSTWYGLFGPKNLPTPIVTKLNAAVNKQLAIKSVQEAIQAQGAEPLAMSVTDFDKFFIKDVNESKAIVESTSAVIQ